MSDRKHLGPVLATGFGKDTGRTRRAKEFRVRLAASDIKRWEVYTTDGVKKRVRGIAASEGLSAGVACEALLNLGIATYLSRKLASSTSPSTHLRGQVDPVKAPSSLQLAMRSHLGLGPQPDSPSLQTKINNLVSYSSRPREK